jgi:hypothetical protein
MEIVVNMRGKALLFKTISVQQKELHKHRTGLNRRGQVESCLPGFSLNKLSFGGPRRHPTSALPARSDAVVFCFCVGYFVIGPLAFLKLAK